MILIWFSLAIYYGNKIKYLGVTVNTTINRRTTGYSKGIPIVKRWEALINDRVGVLSIKPDINLKEFIQFEIVRLSPVDAKTK